MAGNLVILGNAIKEVLVQLNNQATAIKNSTSTSVPANQALLASVQQNSSGGGLSTVFFKNEAGTNLGQAIGANSSHTHSLEIKRSGTNYTITLNPVTTGTQSKTLDFKHSHSLGTILSGSKNVTITTGDMTVGNYMTSFDMSTSAWYQGTRPKLKGSGTSIYGYLTPTSNGNHFLGFLAASVSGSTYSDCKGEAYIYASGKICAKDLGTSVKTVYSNGWKNAVKKVDFPSRTSSNKYTNVTVTGPSSTVDSSSNVTKTYVAHNGSASAGKGSSRWTEDGTDDAYSFHSGARRITVNDVGKTLYYNYNVSISIENPYLISN